MKDKEKQIEEIAKIMCGNDCEECAKESANFYGQTLEEARNNKCLLKNCAKTLYNAGYRKIEDYEVVISKDEYERLNDTVNLRKVRKETAKDILNKGHKYLINSNDKAVAFSCFLGVLEHDYGVKVEE